MSTMHVMTYMAYAKISNIVGLVLPAWPCSMEVRKHRQQRTICPPCLPPLHHQPRSGAAHCCQCCKTQVQSGGLIQMSPRISRESLSRAAWPQRWSVLDCQCQDGIIRPCSADQAGLCRSAGIADNLIPIGQAWAELSPVTSWQRLCQTMAVVVVIITRWALHFEICEYCQSTSKVQASILQKTRVLWLTGGDRTSGGGDRKPVDQQRLLQFHSRIRGLAAIGGAAGRRQHQPRH